nr:MAG TPA: hypothetical protein [Caudoviricetes sp.]
MEEFTKIIKNLFREKINIVIALLVSILALNIYQIVVESNNCVKIRKRIDYRYFNSTKTLEELNNVEINTYNGEIKKYR